MRLVTGPNNDETSELVERLREDYQFNPASSVATRRGTLLTEGISGVKYNSLTLKNSLEVLGEVGTKEALNTFNSKMPTILRKVLGRIPGSIGFDPRDDIDCANNSFVRFVGYLSLNEVPATEGIDGFIESLELDTTYW